jgi:ADP-ribose pyrophosphatase
MTEPIPDARPWRRIDSEPGPELILFHTRFDRLVNPRNDKEMRAVVLEGPDWVNVVAITPAEKIVAVSQYRFGAGKPSLEIPAGLLDEGETPLECAKRELEEETGYTAPEWSSLGWCHPNPAFLQNRLHLFLARGARPTSAPRPEAGEDILFGELSLAEVRQAIADGRIHNGMSLLALYRAFDLRSPAG